jgi:hypothetical protein
MKNDTYLDDVGLGFGASVDSETGLIRWSDCGGSEIFARGGQDEADAVETLLRKDARALPGDPDDESDDRGLVVFWERVESAVRKICGHSWDRKEDAPAGRKNRSGSAASCGNDAAA